MLIAGSILAVILIAFGATSFWVRRHPLEAFIRMTRRALRRAGMTKRTLGGTVYFTGGRGERTIVLVHGVNDQAGSWVSVVPQLLRDFHVVTLDLPGHGESEPQSGPLPMRAMIDALGAVIERESPDAPVILVGNSMGGWVSMLYASEHPERVARLVLEDASGMAWDLGHVPMFPKDRGEALRLLRMVHGPHTPIAEYLVDAMLRLAPALPQKRVLDAGIMEWLVDARLPKLTMPVTLVWGAHDGLLPLDYASALQSRIAGARLHVIETAAHAPHRQKPAEFTRILLEAIR
jgi:pimeloyl-ACP methyl ester carboxylesterase